MHFQVFSRFFTCRSWFLWNLIVLAWNSAIARVYRQNRLNRFDWALEHLLLRKNRLDVHNIIHNIRVLTSWLLCLTCRLLCISRFQWWWLTAQIYLLNAYVRLNGNCFIWSCTTFSVETTSIGIKKIDFFFLNNVNINWCVR
jgi:hypothetical protein